MQFELLKTNKVHNLNSISKRFLPKIVDGIRHPVEIFLFNHSFHVVVVQWGRNDYYDEFVGFLDIFRQFAYDPPELWSGLTSYLVPYFQCETIEIMFKA